MLFSPSNKLAGLPCFFFDDNKKAPEDSFYVLSCDYKTAINLMGGQTFTFAAPVSPAPNGTLVITPAPTPTAAQLLAQAQAAQTTVINAAAAAAIVGGFTSTALGAAYTYPSTLIDQQNLNAQVTASLLPGVDASWTVLQICCDAKGVWAYLPHTAAQIQQVGLDAHASILGFRVKNATLQAQIAAATTVAEVEGVTW